LITAVSIHRYIRRWGVGGFVFEPLYSPSGSAVRSCMMLFSFAVVVAVNCGIVSRVSLALVCLHNPCYAPLVCAPSLPMRDRAKQAVSESHLFARRRALQYIALCISAWPF
jgi:hypothetical protein